MISYPRIFLQTKQFRREEGYASDITFTAIISNQNKLKNSDAFGLLNCQVMHAKKSRNTGNVWKHCVNSKLSANPM